jgi:hypothetical protein
MDGGTVSLSVGIRGWLPVGGAVTEEMVGDGLGETEGGVGATGGLGGFTGLGYIEARSPGIVGRPTLTPSDAWRVGFARGFNVGGVGIIAGFDGYVAGEDSVGAKINVVGEVVDGTTRKLEVDCMIGSLVGFWVGSSVSVVRGGVGCGIGCCLKSSVSIMEGGVGIGCSFGSSVGLQP